MLTSLTCLPPTCTQQQDQKYFDSADWAMKKEAAAKDGGAAAPPPEPEVQLKPKLEPTPSMQRRISHMDSIGHKGDH